MLRESDRNCQSDASRRLPSQGSRVTQWLTEEASTNVAPETFGRVEWHSMHRLDLTKEHAVRKLVQGAAMG